MFLNLVQIYYYTYLCETGSFYSSNEYKWPFHMAHYKCHITPLHINKNMDIIFFTIPDRCNLF